MKEEQNVFGLGLRPGLGRVQLLYPLNLFLHFHSSLGNFQGSGRKNPVNRPIDFSLEIRGW
jgi:hypothetical protein